ncbi:hypothetical protein LTR53_012074 [Teratosphaeriaceae sp. CCFEE 6253]|nr:hypothetical protein LTR53_012074 [Teratosphaeriaceae sp. CCFEE 6253]
MSNTQTLERSNETGLTDSTHSSSSSAERYRLDEFDSRPVLCYGYRGKLETSSPKDICARLNKDENLRCTKKLIPRGASYIEVKRHDMYLPEEKERYGRFPNYDSSLASIKVPLLAYLSRLVFGTYDELYIVSPETSPASSVAGAESRRMSPSSTWGADSQEEAKMGAAP